MFLFFHVLYQLKLNFMSMFKLYFRLKSSFREKETRIR